MKKLLVVLMVWLVCFAASAANAGLTEMKYYFVRQVKIAEATIPDAQKEIKIITETLAKYKDEKPTMYYVTPDGVKKEAIDDNLVKIIKELDSAVSKVAKVEKQIVDNQNKLRILLNLTEQEERFKIIYKKIIKEYEKNEKRKMDKEIAQRKEMLESGEYTVEQINEHFDNLLIKEAKAQVIKDAKTLWQYKKLLEKRSRSRRRGRPSGRDPRRSRRR